MKWEEKSPWYVESDCGYRISKGPKEMPLRYAAWAPHSKAETPALGYVPTLDEAKKLCEQHFPKRTR